VNSTLQLVPIMILPISPIYSPPVVLAMHRPHGRNV
jgi:hypothetical protein